MLRSNRAWIILSMISRIEHKPMSLQCKIQGKRLINLLHIGKTGGSAIGHALEPYFISRHQIIKFRRHRVRLIDIPKGESVAFFLRDPISRFVSGFHCRQRQSRPRYYVPWLPGERRAFKEFHTPQQLALALSSPNEEKKASAHRAMRCIFHIKRPYRFWFESEEYFLSRLPDIFFIGFQERLTEDFSILKTKLGLSEYIELPNDDIIAHRTPMGLDKRLTDEARENLQTWYQDDYRFIDLCEKVLRENPSLRS